jgi:hypothetical protein
MSKSKSRSKSPLHLNKKRSLQVFKIKEDTNREKSRERKSKEVKQQVATMRKTGSVDYSKTNSRVLPPSKKVSEQLAMAALAAKVKPKKSGDKLLPKPTNSKAKKGGKDASK